MVCIKCSDFTMLAGMLYTIALSVFSPENKHRNEDVESFVEILTDVGPLADNVNFVNRFTTPINNNIVIYTGEYSGCR